MRKYNIKRDIAYYEGMIAGYHLLKQLMLGHINREIFHTSEKIEYLKEELENDTENLRKVLEDGADR